MARGLRACFTAWHSLCEHQAWRLAMLKRSVLRRSSTLYRVVFSGWWEAVVEGKRWRRGVERLEKRREMGMLHLCLCAWQQAVAEDR